MLFGKSNLTAELRQARLAADEGLGGRLLATVATERAEPAHGCPKHQQG